MLFITPPGRTVYTLASTTNPFEQEALLQNLLEGHKIRLLYDLSDPESAKLIENVKALKTQLPNLSIVDYATIFYANQIQKIPEQIQKYPFTDWQNYAQDYQIIEIKDSKDPNYQIFVDFIISSNGVNFVVKNGQTIIENDLDRQAQIIQTLNSTFDLDYNHAYLIKSKDNEEYVGIFMLCELSKEEIMLHYLSGKSQKYPTIKDKKMPYLSAGILEIWKQKFANYQTLSFSNKDEKTKSVYQGSGFLPNSNRRCFVLKNNLQEVDLR